MDGVATYPIISLLVFFALFTGVIIYVFFLMRKEHVEKMAKLPLEDSKKE